MGSKISIEMAEHILNTCPVGTILFNDSGQLVWANQTMARLLGTTPDVLHQMTSGDIQGRFVPAGDDTFRLDENSERFFRINSEEISRQEKRYQVWYVADVSEIEAIRQANQGLKKRVNEFAMLDPDTGLLTFPALLQNLDLLVTRSRRYGNPLSLLKIDVQCADPGLPREALLTAVGHMLKDQMRWADLISRGDDGRFLVIMPETPVDAVDSLLAKIRQNLESLQINLANDKTCKVVANFGLTAWNKGDDGRIILERLDRALAEAQASTGTDMVQV